MLKWSNREEAERASFRDSTEKQQNVNVEQTSAGENAFKKKRSHLNELLENTSDVAEKEIFTLSYA